MERCPNCQGRLTISSPAHPSALAPCFALPPASMQSCARAISASLHVIAAIEDPSTIAKILKHLGLPARAPPRAPAKNPAFYEFTEFASPLLRILAPAALVRPCTSPPPTLIAAPSDDQRPRSASSTKTAVGCRQKQLLGPVPVQRSSKTHRVTYLADHSRRFLALGLRRMGVDFWKKRAVYSPYPPLVRNEISTEVVDLRFVAMKNQSEVVYHDMP